MSSLRISIILFTLVLVVTLNFDYVSSYERNYPGAIELIGFNNNRRSRMKHDFNSGSNGGGGGGGGSGGDSLTPPLKKVQADIETVKQNIEEYNKLFKVDTKKLTEQQKDMLERIVERVARLKESFDIDDVDNSSNISDLNDSYSTYEAEPTTTSIPTTTYIISSDTLSSEIFQDMEQQSSETEARSNHINIDAQTTNSDSGSTISINSGTTNTLNRVNIPTKSKNRLNTTKRPLSSTRTTTKRTTGGHSHRPTASVTSSVSSLSSSSSSSSLPLPSAVTLGSYGTSSGQKIATITTIQPQIKQLQKQQQQQQLHKQQQQLQMQLQQHQQQQQHQNDIALVESSIKQQLPQQQQQQQPQQQDLLDSIEQKTGDHHEILPPRSPVGVTGTSSTADLLYNSNVTTSSIIDSLNANAREDYYNSGGVIITDTASTNSNNNNINNNNNNSNNNSNNNKEKKPSGTAKPTKYHYYPHNQHIYLLPECAIQQVCNAVYVRLNYTQPLCACPSRYRDPCSASLNEDDQHTTKLIGDGKKKAITLAKTCEAVTEMRDCRTPKDWSLLALQNTRTGKSHYLVICRCPDHFKLEGPMAHDQPTYASVPGIRVFGMMCVKPGITIRKPSAQPPKRYQLQKPYYVPSNNRYPSNSDTRQPTLSLYQQQHQQPDNSYQSQYQSNYQYLSRPTSSSIISNSHTEYPDSQQLSTFSGVYGRNNERKGENNVEAVEDGTGDNTNSTTSNNNNNNNNNNNSNNNNNDDSNSNSSSTTTSSSSSTININNNNNNNSEKSNNNDDETILATANREKRSIVNDYSDMPEFPWDRIEEFQKTIVWD